MDELEAFLSEEIKQSSNNPSESCWLDQFAGTPFYNKAVQMSESELQLRQERLKNRVQREQEHQAESALWTREDALRLEKDMLELELHKSMSQPQAPAQAKQAMHITGRINNGEPDPTLPQASMGVESAGRPATPEEKKTQNDTATPQHVAPARSGGSMPLAKKASNLDAEDRAELSKSEFALPAKKKYPIPDEAHARNALARAAQFASKSEQATIRRKVEERFPGIDLTSASKPTQPTVGHRKKHKAEEVLASKKGKEKTSSAGSSAAGRIGAALGKMRPPPIPTAAKTPRSLFATAPGPSVFSGMAHGPAPKLGPAKPLGAGSLQTKEFISRHPTTAAIGESAEVARHLASKGDAGLAIAKRHGIGGMIGAQQAADANAPRLRQMARNLGIAES